MAIRELWLVRHGESVGNVAATAALQLGAERIDLDIRDADVPLSDVGREQAEALGTWLAEHGPTVAWVSPYLRARETLRIAAESAGVDVPVIVDERLRDRELGILDLLTPRGVAARHPEEAARRKHLGKFYHRPPGGESWADVALRLRSFGRDMSAHDGERVLVVAHDAVVMLMLYLLGDMAEAELLAYAADHTVLNASVTTLVRRDEGWTLKSFSDVAHLQREGADVTVHPGSPDVEPS